MSKIRPLVNIENKSEIHLEKELFQNKVIRPVLKMQHDIIVKIFNIYIKKLATDWDNLKKSKKIQFIDNQLSKNIQLKNLVIGIVVGQLDETEIDEYIIHSREYNKRIIQMSIQRLLSTV
jgi:hypothetical protein